MFRDVDGMATVPSGEHCLPGIWAVGEGGKASDLANRLKGIIIRDVQEASARSS